MKSFSINCVDSKKQPAGTQNVSMSSEATDAHTITFYSQTDKQPIFTIDTENGELTLDNTNGLFNALSAEQSILKIKIKNVKMDYADNLTFTVEGSKKTFRIAGNSFEQKNGTSFTPVVTFDNPLDIVLPTTLFTDINNQKIKVDTLPFQMFSAFDEEDKSLGIQTFESADKSLHLIKVNNQLYIGRGHKLVPVDINNQNFYKMGNNSVLGFTMGRKNGINGKQSAGIACLLPEDELLKVAEFINGSIDGTIFKTEEDYNNNDIDYSRINAQSDAIKVLPSKSEEKAVVTDIEPSAKPETPHTLPTDSDKNPLSPGLTPVKKTTNNNPNGNETTSDDLSGDPTDDPDKPKNTSDAATETVGKPADDKPNDGQDSSSPTKPDDEKVEENSNNNSSSEQPKETSEKKTEKSDNANTEKKGDSKNNKSPIVITKDTCKVLAIIMGALLISGAVVAPWMFWMFVILAVASYTTETIASINLPNLKNDKQKKSKLEKVRDILAKEKDKLAKLEKLPETKRNIRSKEKLINKIAKHEHYIKEHSDNSTSIDESQNIPEANANDEPSPDTETKPNSVAPSDEALNEHENVATESLPQTSVTPTTNDPVDTIQEEHADMFSDVDSQKQTSAETELTPTFDSARTQINSLLETIKSNPESKQENLQLIDKIIEQVCPDGKKAESLMPEDRETFSKFIDYRLSRMRATGAEERVERAKTNGDFMESDQEDLDLARHELNESINSMYEATKTQEPQETTTTALVPISEEQHKYDSSDELIK